MALTSSSVESTDIRSPHQPPRSEFRGRLRTKNGIARRAILGPRKQHRRGAQWKAYRGGGKDTPRGALFGPQRCQCEIHPECVNFRIHRFRHPLRHVQPQSCCPAVKPHQEPHPMPSSQQTATDDYNKDNAKPTPVHPCTLMTSNQAERASALKTSIVVTDCVCLSPRSNS